MKNYDTVEAAIQDISGRTNIIIGTSIKCRGRNGINDGGGGEFVIYDNSDHNYEENYGTIRLCGQRALVYVKKAGKPVSVRLFGAKGNGQTNDIEAFDHAVAAEKNIFVPKGMYKLDKLDDTLKNGVRISSPFDENGKNTHDRDGRHIVGEINKKNKELLSTLKIGDGAGYEFRLFCGFVNQEVRDWRFSNFRVELNGNNNNTIYKLPYYCFIYAICPCYNIIIENIEINNASGHQVIRLGGDDISDGKWARTGGEGYHLSNVSVHNFGIGLTKDSAYQDISVFYLNGSDILIENCEFRCDKKLWPGDLSIGHTAIEVHPGNGVNIRNCYFEGLHLPVGIYGDFGDVNNVLVSNCKMADCAYVAKVSGSTIVPFKMVNIRVDHIKYESSQAGIGILHMGENEKPDKNGVMVKELCTKKEIFVTNSSFRINKKARTIAFPNIPIISIPDRIPITLSSGHESGYGNIIHFDGHVLTKLVIDKCQFRYIEGPVVFFRQRSTTPALTMGIRHSTLDSCGADPNKLINPPPENSAVLAQLSFEHSDGDGNPKPTTDITIQGNRFSNSSKLVYRDHGHIWIYAGKVEDEIGLVVNCKILGNFLNDDIDNPLLKTGGKMNNIDLDFRP